ncbi:hypothetical protein FA13DRAFT_1741358 [Coprinellus micaceus]|uniref:Uncharacterized protein n=1 Tax=Coprinellus micaceus TaxID=71717 RepID=A0A4Y7SL40_COPMI|nr:hypothetical protein FA13DRAFT_1741358 [Coprinellus micaceus]
MRKDTPRFLTGQAEDLITRTLTLLLPAKDKAKFGPRLKLNTLMVPHSYDSPRTTGSSELLLPVSFLFLLS